MNRTDPILIIACLLAGVNSILTGCGKIGKGQRPTISVVIEGSTVKSGDRFDLPKIDPAAPAKLFKVKVYNHGSKDLVIEDVFLEEGGNRYLTLQWDGQFGPEDFPLTIEPGLAAPKLEFSLKWDPQADPVDLSDSKLIIISDDPDYKKEEGKFVLILGVESTGPELQVNRSSIVFSCVSALCSEVDVTIDNDGTEQLVITEIDFATPTTELTLHNLPTLPLTMSPKGDPAYYPATFKVQYCPEDADYDDANELRIYSNDPLYPDGYRSIPVEIKQKPAYVSFTTDSPFGYLDFSGDIKSYTISMYNMAASECDDMCPDKGNCCGCPARVTGLEFDPEDAKDWYSVKITDSEGNEKNIPYTLSGGHALNFELTYAIPSGQTDDKNAEYCINYATPLEGPQKYCVSAMAKAECEFEVSPPGMILHFNSASPGDKVVKTMVLVNNGGAPCHVNSLEVTNMYATGPSQDFTLSQPFAADTELEPFSLYPIDIQFAPSEIADKYTAYAKISYQDQIAGTVEISVSLQGTADEECKIPIANPGSSETYSDIKTGDTVLLNGCQSTPGECGGDLYEQGYIWYLVQKPKGSSAALNYEGGCTANFVPDLAGIYTVALIVYDQENFYQSDMATVDIQVEE